MRDRTASVVLGLPLFTVRRALLLSVCILGVVQYGLTTVFGVIAGDLEPYYGLTPEQGDELYAWMNFGSCALSFIPGLCYDRVGPAVAMAVGTLCGISPVVLQLMWTSTFPAFIGTMGGLSFSYMLFGFAASFYNVIGCFAPLEGFPKKDIGKVSAVVQVCLSLGLTVQTWAYTMLKQSGGDYIESYLVYVCVSTGACGALMTWALHACRPLFERAAPARGAPPRAGRGPRAGAAAVEAGSWAAPLAIEGAAAAEEASISSERPSRLAGRSARGQVLSVEFAVMSLLFLFPIGYSFSFLDVESRIAQQAVVRAPFLAQRFGFWNALGRILTCVPLDFTKGRRLGGVFTYVVFALFVFFLGLLWLVLVPEPQAHAVRNANMLMALGYGGLLGIVPAAIKLVFGSEHLGLIYGLLYFWVYIAVLLWGRLAQVPSGCAGVACYRTYCAGGAVCTFLTGVACCWMLWEDERSRRGHASRRAAPAETPRFPSRGST